MGPHLSLFKTLPSVSVKHIFRQPFIEELFDILSLVTTPIKQYPKASLNNLVHKFLRVLKHYCYASIANDANLKKVLHSTIGERMNLFLEY